MARAMALYSVAAVGGAVHKSVTKKTNVLVIGPRRYNGEVMNRDRMSTKMKRAEALLAKGAVGLGGILLVPRISYGPAAGR
jgi:hypothetical protein